MKKIRRLIVTLAALVLMVSAAKGQSRCGPYPLIRDSLEKKHGEQLAGIGVTEQGNSAYQIWRNLKTQTWTIVAVHLRPGQQVPMGCLVAAGKGWSGKALREADFEPKVPS